MRSFRKKPNTGIKTKLINSLVLFGIVAQIFMPIMAFADHTKEMARDWHSKANYNKLTREEYDKFNKMVKASQEALTEGYNEIMTKYSTKSKDELLKLNLPHASNFSQTDNQQISDGCSSSGWTITCLLKRGLASIGYFFLQISAIALNLASQIFDQSAKVSLSYQTYSSKHAVAVYEAWRVARDFVNMLFIFMILVIALSFILQIKDYGSQQVLIRLVMIAILINFSFFITQQVINFSNSAAMYFKNGILNSVNEGKPENEQMGIGDFFVEKLKPQILFSGYKANMKLDIGSQNPELAGKIKETLTDNPDISWLSIVITSIGGVIIILYAAFIFFAAAILFVLRTIVLWILMALAPFAFVAGIFPATKGSFLKWRSRLWNEVMFPPIMMFMFYFTAKILDKNFLETYVSQGQARTSLGNSAIFNYYLVLQYIFILILLSYSVFLAKSYGATGAQWVSKQENWLKNKAKNIGKTATVSPAKWAGRGIGRGIGRGARSVVAPLAERISTTDSKWGGRFAKITGVRRGAESIVASERAYAKTTDKRLGNLTSKELESRLKTSFMGGTLTKANMDLIQELQKRGDLGKVSPKLMEKMHTYMSDIGENTKDIETYMPSLAGRGKTGAEKDNAIRKATQREQADKVSDYIKIESETNNNETTNARRQEWGESHLKKVFELSNAGDKNANEFMLNMLKNYISEYRAIDPATNQIDLGKIVKGLEEEQNFSASKFTNSIEGSAYIEDFINKHKTELGVTSIKIPKGAMEEQAKKDVKSDGNEIAKMIHEEKDQGFINDKENTRISELVNVAGIDKMIEILKNLEFIETRELKNMLRAKNQGLENKIINVSPEIAENSNERQNSFKTMSQKEIEGFDYKGLGERIDRLIAAGKLTGTKDTYLNEILEDMIKGFTRTQYENLFKSGNDLNEAIIQKLKDISVNQPGTTPLAKVTSYLRTLPQSKNSVAGYIEGSPSSANSFK